MQTECDLHELGSHDGLVNLIEKYRDEQREETLCFLLGHFDNPTGQTLAQLEAIWAEKADEIWLTADDYEAKRDVDAAWEATERFANYLFGVLGRTDLIRGVGDDVF